jgi:hypothetical protein
MNRSNTVRGFETGLESSASAMAWPMRRRCSGRHVQETCLDVLAHERDWASARNSARKRSRAVTKPGRRDVGSRRRSVGETRARCITRSRRISGIHSSISYVIASVNRSEGFHFNLARWVIAVVRRCVDCHRRDISSTSFHSVAPFGGFVISILVKEPSIQILNGKKTFLRGRTLGILHALQAQSPQQ